MNDWYVYIIRCSNNSLYCGITNNLLNRWHMHCEGKAAYYTRAFPPQSLVCAVGGFDRREALKLEYQVKQHGSFTKEAFLKSKADATHPLINSPAAS